MTWTAPTPTPADGPTTGDDRTILEGYLNWQRSTLLSICAGLTGEQLARRPIPSSNLSLLGLIRHLAKVERIWFRQRAAGQPVPPMYDPALGKDADFNDAVAAGAETDLARLRAEWQQADAAAAGLDFAGTFDAGHGDTFSVRMMYVHLIGEYARHNGHADLLREALDGVTGR
ncbi:MAG TPA: DinB family protein [Streptosporangiaceae bacterium]|nr:DinB family protein [Streptosporangiaceae bacterium]